MPSTTFLRNNSISWIIQQRGLNFKAAALLRSPTLKHTLKFFHRDLENISLHGREVTRIFLLSLILSSVRHDREYRHPRGPGVSDRRPTPTLRIARERPHSMPSLRQEKCVPRRWAVTPHPHQVRHLCTMSRSFFDLYCDVDTKKTSLRPETSTTTGQT